MDNDEISQYLAALQREDRYRVDSTLKESPHELTQRVLFIGEDGSECGPYVRKLIRRGAGLGSAYERIFEAQRRGQRFKHIPTIVECYSREDGLVVVMEFVEGETLQELVYQRDPSADLAADLFPSLCDAVSELHESFDPALIHRDLKPSNIMVCDDEPMIIDFGIAREFKQGAEADTTKFGTRAFAPPEQFGFGQTTVRSDVYALGMLLYYCLTEKIPSQQVRDAKFEGEGISDSLRAVIVKATELDPEARYASAAELKAGFLDAMSSATARRNSDRRHVAIPVAAATASAIAIALAVALFGVFGDTNDQTQPALETAQRESASPDASEGDQQEIRDSGEEAGEALIEGSQLQVPQRDGFDPSTNIKATIAGVTFQIPSYFGARVERGDDDVTYYYAESGSSLAMIMTNDTPLSSDAGNAVETAGPDELQQVKDDILAGMIESDEAVFKEVVSSTDFELAGMPARVVTVEGSIKGIPETTQAVYFINGQTRSIGSLIFGQTENVQLDCSADFSKVIASAVRAA